MLCQSNWPQSDHRMCDNPFNGIPFSFPVFCLIFSHIISCSISLSIFRIGTCFIETEWIYFQWISHQLLTWRVTCSNWQMPMAPRLPIGTDVHHLLKIFYLTQKSDLFVWSVWLWFFSLLVNVLSLCLFCLSLHASLQRDVCSISSSSGEAVKSFQAGVLEYCSDLAL